MESPNRHRPKDSATPESDLETCEFCEKIHVRNPDFSRDEINGMFHDYCSTCVPPDLSLCDRCQHMRLRHQLFCEQHETYDETVVPMDDLQVSERDDVPTSCILCSFVLRIALCLAASIEGVSIEIGSADDKHVYPRDDSNRKRRCLLGLEDSSGIDYVSLVAEDLTPSRHAHPEYAERGRAFLSQSQTIKEVIDWNYLKEYLKVCCEEHEGCRQEHSQLPSGFRLIDVQDRCLVRGWPGVEFLALSYVWGTDLERRECVKGALTKNCVEELEHKDSLQPSELPATIEDAIQACMALGERYLWVDRLCILQDDPGSKRHQIHAMGSIFESAKLVIVAAGAENMHAGISGISRLRRTIQVSTRFSGMEVVQQLPHILKSVKTTVWSTRGWTYQEAVLPRRKVWLTDDQAFFECGKGVVSEHNFGKVANAEHLQAGVAQLYPFEMSSAETYYYHLQLYTQRSLTFDSDIFNAFTGIVNSLYGDDSLIFGLPHKDFDQALLWEALDTYAVAREGRDAENLVLPSWTWASVKCQAYRSLRVGSLFCGTLVQWSVCTESEEQPTLLPIKARGEPLRWKKEGLHNRAEPSPHLYLTVAWIQNCIRGNLPPSLQSARNRTFAELDASAQSQWPNYSSFCEDQCSLWIDVNGVPASITAQLKPGDLVGRVLTAFLTIITTSGPYGNECLLRDHCDQIVGMARVYGRSLPTVPNTRIKAVAVSISLSVYNDLTYFASCYPSIQGLNHRDPRFEAAAQELWRDREENFTVFDSVGNALVPPPVVNVILVEESGGFCRRIGLGWAYLTRWMQAGPVFETVVLE